jgi:hypothetical protein
VHRAPSLLPGLACTENDAGKREARNQTRMILADVGARDARVTTILVGQAARSRAARPGVFPGANSQVLLLLRLGLSCHRSWLLRCIVQQLRPPEPCFFDGRVHCSAASPWTRTQNCHKIPFWQPRGLLLSNLGKNYGVPDRLAQQMPLQLKGKSTTPSIFKLFLDIFNHLSYLKYFYKIYIFLLLNKFKI